MPGAARTVTYRSIQYNVPSLPTHSAAFQR
jgi:hypothetical protein